MASRIKGLTIEIGGNVTKLQSALSSLDSSLKNTQNNLRDVEKLLKLNPSSVELLTQKQKYLKDAIAQTSSRLEELKKAQAGVKEGTAEWDALQREIIATENDLNNLQKDLQKFGSVTSQQVQAAGTAMQQFGGKVEEVGNKLRGVSTAAAGALAGLVGLGVKAMKSADEINTIAKQTGMTTAEIQKLQYASEMVDVSLEDVTGAMTKMKSKMTEDNAAFKALGISVTDADGNLRDANEVFYEALGALSKIENPTERDQAAMALFGKSADQLAGIIDDGGAALKAYGEKAEQLGLILDDDVLTSLNETNDAFDESKAQIQKSLLVLGSTIAQNLAPIIEKASELIGKITEKLRELSPEQTETILKIVGIVAAVAPAITLIGKLISGIGGIVSVVGSVVGVLGGPMTLVLAAVIAAGILLYKNWDKIKAYAISLRDSVVQAFNNIKERVTSVIDSVKAKIDTLKQKFEDLKEKISTAWETIKGIFTGEIKFPHIPLPHFKILPEGWKIGDLLKGVLPKLDIEWYRKAYSNPVMFNSPTVMATPNGYKGFGDGNGAEIVMGLDKLRELVGDMDKNITVNVVLQGDARQIFRVVRQENTVRTKATNYNVLAVGV